LGEESARFDLTLWMAEEPRGLNAIWTYRTDLFEDATIERMNGHLQTLLQSIVTSPDVKLDALEMYSEIEKERRTREEKSVREASYQRFKSIKPKTVKRSEN
jgi:non-ribosomal peptide synthetase component F